MKGKNPTRAQRKIIEGVRLNPNNWLVLKNPSHELVLQHRDTNSIKTIKLV